MTLDLSSLQRAVRSLDRAFAVFAEQTGIPDCVRLAKEVEIEAEELSASRKENRNSV